MAVTSYGGNKNHDEEIKKTKRNPIIAPAIAVRLLKIDVKKIEKICRFCQKNAKIRDVNVKTIPPSLETMQ